MKARSIAVSMRSVAPFPSEFHDGLSRGWLPLFDRYRLLPVLVPNGLAQLPLLLHRGKIEAVLLTGGDDLPLGGLTGPLQPRDQTEVELMHHALAEGLPVLGVCRGLQFLNLWFGGGQTRDLNRFETGHVAQRHGVHLHGRFRQVCGDRMDVNSYHDHGVLESDLGANLEILARTDGGVVEAFRHRELPVYAIQWHPERETQTTALDDYLFGEFLRS